jgi:flagellar protein FliJ
LLQEKQRKQKSYEVLISRANTLHEKVERKRDQKMMDEFASRAKRTTL